MLWLAQIRFVLTAETKGEHQCGGVGIAFNELDLANAVCSVIQARSTAEREFDLWAYLILDAPSSAPSCPACCEHFCILILQHL